MQPPQWLPLVAVAATTLVAAATDLHRFRVPNALTLPVLMLGVVVAGLSGGGSGLLLSLAGVGVGLILLGCFFALGGVGAGDVKLFAAMGSWLGPAPLLQVLAASALLAGVYALVLSALSLGIGATAARVLLLGDRMRSPGQWTRPEVAPAPILAEVARPDRRRRLVPFAATTCAGFCVVVALWGHDRSSLRLPAGPVRMAWVGGETLR